jgi:molybdopterin-guanine dinucleotide biosynthesis protein B
MRVILIVGHSGAGKTTLIEQLVQTATTRGLVVATIKHAHHRVTLDTPGKDSWRYTQAGAAKSLLVTQDGLQLVTSLPAESDPHALAQVYMADADLVFAEGFSESPGPKIEVLRRACSAQPRCTPAQGLIALVTDVADVYPQLPHFALNDIEDLLAFILARDPA